MGHFARVPIRSRPVQKLGHLGDLVLQVIARQCLGHLFLNLGDYVRARDLLRWVVEGLDREVASQTVPRLRHGPEGRERGEARKDRFPTLDVGLLVSPRALLTFTLGTLGQFVEGISLGEQAIRIAESGDNQIDRVVAGYALGHLYVRKGDLDRAIPLLEHSLGLARTWSIWNWRDNAIGALSYAYALSGRYDGAFRLLQEYLNIDDPADHQAGARLSSSGEKWPK